MKLNYAVPVLLINIAAGIRMPKISHATVLLPDDPRATFTLSTENGCFSFSTDRGDLLNLLPMGTAGCATSVAVSRSPSYQADTQPPSSVRGIVSAKDSKTGLDLRSEIHVTTLSRLEVVTRIRRLSVGEVEAIQVQGYDRFGNTFSTLEGMEFKWEVSPRSTGGDISILGIVPLKSTEYSLSSSRLDLEESGKQSDMLIIVGEGPGKSTISVSYAGLATSHPVTMSVVENFDIIPALVGIPFCAHAHLQLRTSTNPKISLPDKAYSFSVPAVARQSVVVDSSGKVSSITQNPIQASVTVIDTRTDDNEQTARVCVGEITELRIVPETLYPVVGSSVGVKVVASSKDCLHVSEMYLSAEVEVHANFTGDSFSARDVSVGAKQTIFEVSAPAVSGKTVKVSAHLVSVGNGVSCAWRTRVKPITAASVELRTVNPVSVVATSVVVPVGEELFIIGVSGGSGEYAVSHSGSSDCAVSVVGSSVSISGSDCSGSVVVSDSLNIKNFANIEITGTSDAVQVSLLSEPVEAFIGYEFPFETTVTAATETAPLFNCSSLISSVEIVDTAIAAVKFAPWSGEPGCGKLTVIPIKPGMTELEIKCGSSQCSSRTVPVVVHSAFAISPRDPLFDPAIAVIGVNASLIFDVSGGSLSRLSSNEEIVALSHPWIADVATNRAENTVRVFCKTEGKSSVQIAHANQSSIDFECVDVIGITVFGDSTGPKVSSTLFVTCGHEEDHSMRIVGLDSQNRRVDNFIYSAVVWESIVGNDLTFYVPPMPCDTERVLKPSVTLSPSETELQTTVTVKARNTVRSTIGQQLSKKPLVLPCEFLSESPIMQYGIQFIGGSGEYAVIDGGGVISGRLSSTVPPTGLAAIGDAGTFSADFDARQCGKGITFAVMDKRLSDSQSEMSLKLQPIQSVTAHIAGVDSGTEKSAVIVAEEWTEIKLNVKFVDGSLMDSDVDEKWFSVLASVFRWSVATDGGNMDFKIKGGKLFTKISLESELVTHRTLSVVSLNVHIGTSAAVRVTVVRRAELSPTGPQGIWTLVPGAAHDLQARYIDASKNSELDFSFNATGPVNITRMKQDIVTVVASNSTTSGTGSITFLAKTRHGRVVYSVSLPVVVSSPSSLRIGSGEDVFVQAGLPVSLTVNFVDLNHQPFFPPHQVAICQVKWSVYGSQSGQTLTHTFAQKGSSPVKALVQCQSPIMKTREVSVTVHAVANDRLIAPLANLVTSSEYSGLSWPGRESQETPSEEGFESVFLSESQIGSVLYRKMAFSHLVTESLRITVGESVTIGHVELLDSHGHPLVMPDNLHQVVGSSRPGLLAVSADRDNVIVSGIHSGCAFVYSHLNGDLVGVREVCSDWPVVPRGSEAGLVVAPGSEFTLAAASDLTRIMLQDLNGLDISVLDGLQRLASGAFEIRTNKGLEWALKQQKTFGFTAASQGEWKSGNNACAVTQISTGQAKVSCNGNAKAIVTSILVLNRLSVDVSVEPLAKLKRVSSNSVSAKQSEATTLVFQPISMSGKQYSVSPLIDQKWSHACELSVSSSEYFKVMPVVSAEGYPACELTPVVKPNRRLSSGDTIALTVTVGSISQQFQVHTDPHFHLVTGALSIPVPAKLYSASESVLMRVASLADVSKCQVTMRPRHSHFHISQVNATGHFQVLRTVPFGPSETALVVMCGGQMIETKLSFLDASNGFDESRVTIDGSHEMSVFDMALWVTGIVAKVVASIAVIAGVALLFQRKSGASISVEKKEFRGSISRPQFSPHPHQDKDTFISTPPERISRRTTGHVVKWTNVAE